MKKENLELFQNGNIIEFANGSHGLVMRVDYPNGSPYIFIVADKWGSPLHRAYKDDTFCHSGKSDKSQGYCINKIFKGDNCPDPTFGKKLHNGATELVWQRKD